MVFKALVAAAHQVTRAKAQYRASWLSEGVWALGFTASTFAFWQIVARRFSLPAWSAGRIDVFLAFVELYWGLSRGMFAGTRSLAHMIYTGGLDRFLVRPVDARLLVLASKFEPIPLVRGVSLFVAWTVVAESEGQSLHIGWMIGGIALCAGGTLCFVAALLALCSLAFYLERVDALDEIFGSTFDSVRYPIDVMQRALAAIFTYLLPASAVATWPALMAIQRRLDLSTVMVMGGLLLAWGALAEALWRRGLLRYDSSSGR